MMDVSIRGRAALVALASMVVSASGTAQAPVGGATLPERAAQESLAVLRTLDEAVRRTPADAAAWHRRGVLAWLLADRANAKPAVRGLDASRLVRTANESLREAVERDQDNARYRLTLGQYLLTSGTTMSRASAYAHIDRALDIARASGVRPLHADAAIEAGRIRWRRYDSDANRRIETEPGLARSIEQAVRQNPLTSLNPSNEVRVSTPAALNLLHSQLIDRTQAMPPDFGVRNYQEAEALFREAVNADPASPRAFRQLAMLLAEKARWPELREVAVARTQRHGSDAWGWFALGLAEHRMRDAVGARTAFDTAVARLDARERARLTGIHRIMKPADTLSYVQAAPEQREATEQTFWLLSDPLWSRPGNDSRSEFLARVAYAELRWTVEELGMRGADSDRGNIYIRFGPPDVIAKLAPSNSGTDITQMDWRDRPVYDDTGAELSEITFWDYDTGMLVVFWGMPTFGTARYARDDQQHVDFLVDETPVRWDNVSTERVEPMPAYVARFRGAGDSVDVLLAANAPVAAIRSSSASNATVRADLWIFGREVPNAYRDSVTLGASGLTKWIYRVPPATYMYRIEATAPGAGVAGATWAWVPARSDSTSGFTTRGFGVSDLLVGTAGAPSAPGRRWHEHDVAPLLGSLAQSAELALVWENYEFGSRGGAAQYDLTVTIQRQRSTGGRIAAEVVGALARVVGVDRRDDRVVVRLDRTVPYAAAITDRVDLALHTTPPGDYRLTLQITDRVSGRTVTRATGFTIR